MKKVFCTVLTFVLIVSLFAPLSFAAEDDFFRISKGVGETNLVIEEMIDEAIEKVDKEKEKVKQGDKEDKLQEKITRIINCLIDDTNRVSAKMQEKAEKVGIKVICDWVEVEIGGQIVEIDPLRIVGF